MTNIGIDVGTSAIKAVSENNKVTFPSAYLQIENGSQILEYVGHDALKYSFKDNTTFSWPIVKGRFTNYERETEYLIRAAINQVIGKEPKDLSNVNVAIGLPNLAMEDVEKISSLLKEKMQTGKVAVYHQTLGTLVAENESTGIVVSIGHGTTEIMSFYDLEPVNGYSWEQASDKVLESLGDMFWDAEYIKENSETIRPAVKAFATELANKIQQFQGKLLGRIKDPRVRDQMKIIITGGGILIPHMRDELEARLGDSFTVAKDPIFSNAIGLQKIATQVLGSKK